MSPNSPLCLFVLWATISSFGVCAPSSAQCADRDAEDDLSTEQKRDLLNDVLTGHLKYDHQRHQVHRQLDRMSPEQIDRLFEVYLARRAQVEQARLDAAQRNLAEAIAYRDHLQRLYDHQLQARRAGYFPVITWLPEGAHLGASAVVSPDRRYVRVQAMPFFSSVGPVDAFNFSTGQSYRLPQFDPVPPPAARPQTWYDGLRTQVGPRP
jgi:hypothetical protein